MALAVITLVLLGITLISFIIGTVWLAKYAFRLGTGPGLGVLLFPPYTFYFAFYKLDVDAKDRPTALWMFGLVASVLLVLIFQGPLSAAARGDMAALAAPVEQPKKKINIDEIPDPAAPSTTTTPPATTPPATTPPATTPPADGTAVDPNAAPAAGTPPADGAAAPADGAAPAGGTAAPAAGTPPAGDAAPATGTATGTAPAAGTP